jgi:hypothetical protein
MDVPQAATHVIGSDGRILFADLGVDIATARIRWMSSRC